MSTSEHPVRSSVTETVGNHTLTILCDACGAVVEIDRRTRLTRTADGSQGVVTFADAALLVWVCPACNETQAEDLTD